MTTAHIPILVPVTTNNLQVDVTIIPTTHVHIDIPGAEKSIQEKLPQNGFEIYKVLFRPMPWGIVNQKTVTFVQVANAIRDHQVLFSGSAHMEWKACHQALAV